MTKSRTDLKKEIIDELEKAVDSMENENIHYRKYVYYDLEWNNVSSMLYHYKEEKHTKGRVKHIEITRIDAYNYDDDGALYYDDIGDFDPSYFEEAIEKALDQILAVQITA